ncbi:MAG TPA: TonB-dependent receptor, partial [Candidatus Polarisedimenticolia bacterium]|nr:TonB-dependent receptor [Candidatus Polarisedimenticolia bacterium]
MILKRSFPFLVLLAGCILLALPSLLSAQTTAGLKGTVLDKDGAPIPGATVLVTNPALGISQGGVTDAKGEFRITPLAPGRGYELAVSFPGMAKVKLSDIELNSGKISTLQVTLRPEKEMQEKVTVKAISEVVNTADTTTQTSFTSEFIDSLPIIGRNYQDVLALAPGVSDDDGDGNPNIHGARDTDVITLVDGVSTTDPYTGKRGQELNIDSIQEIEVKTSGSSAEFGRGQGGYVTIVTKSGGNDFEGRFQFYWRSNLLDGDGAGIDDPQLHGGLGELGLRDLKFTDYLPFISVSGPIKKDKAWYYFTGEYIQEQTPVNALTQAFVRTTKEKRIFGKLSWDVSTNHKLVFTATIDPQEFDNEGLDSFTAVEAGYTEKEGGQNYVLKETAVFNPNVFLETTVQHFNSSPKVIPTLDADTNHNGILFIDRNHNHFIDATERDPGQDYDRDNHWDVFEDFLKKNGQLDDGEDRDLDGRLTPPHACEGETREDQDCDGFLDTINEDDTFCNIPGDPRCHNNQLDVGEDRDGDNFLDGGFDANGNPWVSEDRNHNGGVPDDRPLPQADDVIPDCVPGTVPCQVIGHEPAYYPYNRFLPLPRDRDLQQDQRNLRINGPYNESIDRTLGRVTLRQDLTVFLPDKGGQHDIKMGGIIERETFSSDTSLRPYLFPNAQPAGSTSLNPSIGVQLPAENQVFNTANSTTFGMYINDTYKPIPNLTLNLGLRFDREATDSFGYTPFDPLQQRILFDRINALRGGEINKAEDLTEG